MSTVKAVSRRPCERCPFRKDVPIYLRQERRVEIAKHIFNGGMFPCHETTHVSEDENGEEELIATDASLECAGAAKAIMAVGGTTQTMRIAERFGWVDLDDIDQNGAECWNLNEWPKLEEGSTGTEALLEAVETCHVVDSGCTAPAGFLGASGAVLDGAEWADFECECCGEWTCENCSDGAGHCNMCVEDGFVDEED
jgi:hypothetical protein